MYGGTPTCPTCSRPVYHAEQIMGPGRNMYHKPCLVCSNCKTRVDPGALQEHDGKAYCRNCHRQLFSPRDLRSANVYTSSPSAGPSRPSAPSTPSRPSRTALPPSDLGSTPIKRSEGSYTSTQGTYRSVDEAVGATAGEGPGTDSEYAPFRIVPRSNPLALSSATSITAEASSPSIGTSGVTEKISTARAPPSVLPKPSNLTSSTQASFELPTKSDSHVTTSTPTTAPAKTSPMTPTRTPGRTYGSPASASIVRAGFGASPGPGGGGDVCPTCGKKVYLMEAVNALSRKWHKGCLKCTACKSTLDPNKLCDRDGSAYCKKCYHAQFGPVGIL
ncbi:hypothetical protein FFLO_01427 [Filobasidium floriforme]|uniref:LIM zinc-binding domain-containing protein n=1 Tax=Filobasidium floriforme TaxID=5210 RepID=A0A8K0NSP0_9TREE|nr:hypothetical protein FFLO_01427 [Filobasidium floriforme]